MLWGLSLQFWQTVVFWLWAIAAGTGGLAVAASFASSVISYYISEETQTAANRDIAQANATAGTANAAAGDANERAAKLALELEQERIARLEIEARVKAQGDQVQELMPRRLSAGQSAAIFNEISSIRGSISVEHDMAAGVVKNFVADLSSAFTRSGWRVANPLVMASGLPADTGIVLKVFNAASLTNTEASVKRALEKAGIAHNIVASRRTLPHDLLPGVGFAGTPLAMFADVELYVTVPTGSHSNVTRPSPND